MPPRKKQPTTKATEEDDNQPGQPPAANEPEEMEAPNELPAIPEGPGEQEQFPLPLPSEPKNIPWGDSADAAAY